MKILVGIVRGEAYDAVTELARMHAVHFNAKVYLVTSLKGGSFTSEKELEQAEQALEYAKASFEKQGIDCEAHLIIEGKSPNIDLVEFAHKKDVDEIIVGARKRRSPIGKAILGSVTQSVALTAPCPVVLVK